MHIPLTRRDKETLRVWRHAKLRWDRAGAYASVALFGLGLLAKHRVDVHAQHLTCRMLSQFP